MGQFWRLCKLLPYTAQPLQLKRGRAWQQGWPISRDFWDWLCLTSEGPGLATEYALLSVSYLQNYSTQVLG